MSKADYGGACGVKFDQVVRPEPYLRETAWSNPLRDRSLAIMRNEVHIDCSQAAKDVIKIRMQRRTCAAMCCAVQPLCID